MHEAGHLYRRSPPREPSPSSHSDTREAIRLAEGFVRINLRPRARMLGRLIASVGSLALAVVGGGAFAKYITQARWPEIRVSLEDAARTTASQVFELLRYVEQSNPRLFERLRDELGPMYRADEANAATAGAC